MNMPGLFDACKATLIRSRTTTRRRECWEMLTRRSVVSFRAGDESEIKHTFQAISRARLQRIQKFVHFNQDLALIGNEDVMVGIRDPDDTRGWLASLKCINLPCLICVSRSRCCDVFRGIRMKVRPLVLRIAHDCKNRQVDWCGVVLRAFDDGTARLRLGIWSTDTTVRVRQKTFMGFGLGRNTPTASASLFVMAVKLALSVTLGGPKGGGSGFSTLCAFRLKFSSNCGSAPLTCSISIVSSGVLASASIFCWRSLRVAS